jgi:hypothetical protein
MADGDQIVIPVDPAIIPDGLGLGRNVFHDPRSRAFAVSVPMGIEIRSVRHDVVKTTLNQGNIGACTRFSLQMALMTRPLWNGLWNFTNEDGWRGYARQTQIDPFPGTFTYPPPGGQDTGSDGNSAAWVAREQGLITGWSHAFGVQQSLETLMLQPDTTGTIWTQTMFYPDADGRVHPTGAVAGGHQYERIGYDAERRRLWCLTPWGQWGPFGDGTFYIALDDYANLLAQNGDVTVPKVGTAPPPQPPQPQPQTAHVFGTKYGRYYHRPNHRVTGWVYVYEWAGPAQARLAGRYPCHVCRPAMSASIDDE